MYFHENILHGLFCILPVLQVVETEVKGQVLVCFVNF